jgi:hypothetical protein
MRDGKSLQREHESHHVDGKNGHQSSSVPVVCDPASIVYLSDYVVQGVPWDFILFKKSSSEYYSETGGRGRWRERKVEGHERWGGRRGLLEVRIREEHQLAQE